MKSTVFFMMTVAVLAAMVAGCATSKPVDKVQQTESMLMQSGFRAIPATTPGQVQQLQTLRLGTISAVTRSGKRYYVYPDAAQKLIFVGNESQYQAYRSNLQGKQEEAQYDSIFRSDPAAAAYNNEAEMLEGNESFDTWRRSGWGSWDMPE